MCSTAKRWWRGVFEYDIVVLVSLLWFMILFLRFSYPPLFETFQSIYGVSNAQTGLLFTLLMLAYSAIQFPAGIVGDRFGRPLIIVLGAVLFAVASVLTAASPSFVVLLAATVLFGLASGPHKGLTIPLLSERYENNTGRALGTVDTVGQFGGMVAPVAVVIVLSVFIWQTVFVLGAAVTLVLSALFYYSIVSDDDLTLRNRPTGSKSTGEHGGLLSYFSVFTNWRLVLFMIVTMLFAFAWNALSSFFPLYLSSEKGFSEGVAGLLYSALFVVSLSQLATGELSDRIGQLTVCTLLSVGMFVGVILLIVADSLIAVGAITIVLGIGFHGIRPVRDSYLMEQIPQHIGGGTLGVIRTMMTGVGALGPAVIGYVSDVAGFDAAFSIIALTVAAGGAVAVVLLLVQR
ncbi:MFS transporter [Natrialbaceae archaeon A-arb3/5]